MAQTLLLAGSIAAAAVLSTEEQWSQVDLVGLLAVVVVGSDFLTLRAKRFRISGSFLGLVLAMALLGPAPAAAMGLACASVDAIRGRIRGSFLLNNLATYAFFPLLGALVLMGLEEVMSEDEGGFALAVFAVFVGRERPQLRPDRGAHRLSARRLADRAVPDGLPAGPAVGARHRVADRDDGLRVRGLRHHA